MMTSVQGPAADPTTRVAWRRLDLLIAAAVVLRVAVDWLPNAVPALVSFTLAWLGLLAFEAVIARRAGRRRVDLLVTGRRLRSAVLAGLASWPLWLAFAVGYTLIRLGHLAWMPLTEYPSTLAAAAFFATTEEILFRGYLLGRLLTLGIPGWAGNLLAAALFVLAHPRYLGDPRPPTLLLALGAAGMSLLAGAVALRYRNAWGAVAVHAGYDLLIFVPLAGAITRL